MAIKRTLRPTEEQIRRHIHANIRCGAPQIVPHLPQNTQIALCAGGASLTDHLEDVRRLQLEDRAEVVCVGNSGHTLARAGIKVNGHILMDGVDRNRTFVVPIPDARYFVASQCDPSVFEALRDHDHVYLWHAGGPEGVEEILQAHYGPGGYFMVPGGSYISLRAITLLNILGYSWIHCFGLDSCLMEGEHHAYAQSNADHYRVEEITIGDRRFRCAYWMLDQATQFVDGINRNHFGNAQLAIHGDGLIAYMLKSGNGPTWSL